MSRLNILLLIGFYFLLRWMKRGKPPGYVVDLLRFVFRPTEHHVRLENARPIAVSALAQNSEFQSKDPIHESNNTPFAGPGTKESPVS